MSAGMSLEKWGDAGLLDRELELLLRLSNSYNKLYILSYSSNKEKEKNLIPESYSKKINIVCKPTLIPNSRIFNYLYVFLMFFVNFKVFYIASVIRSNQFSGIFPGVMASLLARKPLVARSGFHFTNTALYEKGFIYHILMTMWQKLIILSSKKVICSAPLHYSDLVKKYGVKKVKYVPNFISSYDFGNSPVEKNDRVLVCGRFTEQKNYYLLIVAAYLSNLKLNIVVDKAYHQRIKRFSSEMGVDIELILPCANKDLIYMMRSCFAFLQIPLYEGMPKTLLEAMYNCKNVITWDVEGIDESILYGQNVTIVKPSDFHSLVNALILFPKGGGEGNIPSLDKSSNSIESVHKQTISILNEC